MAEKENGSDIRYVRLDDPMEARKNLLESAVDATTLLKRWESYKRIKEKKLIYAKKLRLTMRKIHDEEVEFKKDFPTLHEEMQSSYRATTKSLHIQEKSTMKIEEPKRTELDKELDKIKAKLESLNSRMV